VNFQALSPVGVTVPRDSPSRASSISGKLN
jgi:hypothetical protein